MGHRAKMTLAARRLRQNLTPDFGVSGPYQWGTIASISTGNPSTVGVYLDSASSVSGAVVTTGLPYLSWYTPTVGDVVLIGRMSGAARTQRVVIGDLSTYGTVGFGPSATVLGSGNGVDYHYTDVCHFYAGVNTQTGTLKIAMPTAAYKSQTMQHIVIKGYDYSGNRGPWQVIVGGYNFTDGNWYNFNARIIGRAPFNSVRLAQDGTRNCILLGTTSTVWTYGHIEVTDFYAFFGGQPPSIWAPGGWAMSLITSETGITNIFTPVLDQYTDSSTGALMSSVIATSVYKAANWALAGNSAWNKFTLDTIDSDPGGHFNTSTNTYTAPVAGIYHIDAGIMADTGANTGGLRKIIAIYVNGTEVRRGHDSHVAAGFFTATSVSADVLLAAADLVTFWYYSTAPTTQVGGLAFSRANIRYVGQGV